VIEGADDVREEAPDRLVEIIDGFAKVEPT